jgi:MFS family permease
MPAAADTRVSRTALRVDPNAVLAVVAVAQFMVVLDATVVNVALPTIKRDVGFSEQSLSWVTVAPALCAVGVVVAVVLLPRRRRRTGDARMAAIAMSFARCPGAPYCGHLARVVALGRRLRGADGGV